MHEHPQCPGCGKHHPPVPALAQALMGIFGGVKGIPVGHVLIPLAPPAPSLQPRNPRTAWLYEPLLPKGKPLTAKKIRKRWKRKGKRPHHRSCRVLAQAVKLLDYAFCPRCNVALNEEDVYWQRPGGRA